MFLGQLDNPLGCWLCWVQLFGIDSSALSLPLSTPLPLPYIFSFLSLLFFPLLWENGLRLGLGWEKCRVKGLGLKWGSSSGGGEDLRKRLDLLCLLSSLPLI